MKTFARVFIMSFLIILSLCVPAGAAPVLSKKRASLDVGEKTVLTVKRKGKKKVKWSSSNRLVATVSKKGKVTAKKAGFAVIIARVGKRKLKCRVTVNGAITVDGMDAPKPLPDPEKPASVPVQMNAEELSVYNRIMCMQEKYPSGMKWTNEIYYKWKGGIYRGGYGCAAFAFMLSDEAFGSSRARLTRDVSAIRIGDVLRTDEFSHVVIVIGRYTDGSLVVAEGNVNRQVRWGRRIPKDEFSTICCVITRW